MSAARYNLIIDQGSDFVLAFIVNEDGSAKDLTGYDARAHLRKTKSSSGEPEAQFTCTVPVPAAGEVRMVLPNTTSTAMSAGQYFYDLEIFEPAGTQVVTRILEGTVTLKQEVTR